MVYFIMLFKDLRHSCARTRTYDIFLLSTTFCFLFECIFCCCCCCGIRFYFIGVFQLFETYFIFMQIFPLLYRIGCVAQLLAYIFSLRQPQSIFLAHHLRLASIRFFGRSHSFVRRTSFVMLFSSSSSVVSFVSILLLPSRLTIKEKCIRTRKKIKVNHIHVNSI